MTFSAFLSTVFPLPSSWVQGFVCNRAESPQSLIVSVLVCARHFNRSSVSTLESRASLKSLSGHCPPPLRSDDARCTRTIPRSLQMLKNSPRGGLVVAPPSSSPITSPNATTETASKRYQITNKRACVLENEGLRERWCRSSEAQCPLYLCPIAHGDLFHRQHPM
jgi:hypothetical protein